MRSTRTISPLARPAAIVLLALSCLTTSLASAEDGAFEAGPFIGLNRSILGAPDDPPDTPQFMEGSAYNGFGTTFGGRLRYRLHEFVALAAELGISNDRASGYEDHPASVYGPAWRRDLRFSTWRVRIPVMLMGSYGKDWWRIDAGLGPEFVVPLYASAELDEQDVPDDQRFDLAIETAPQLGLVFDVGGAFEVKPDLRLTTNVQISLLSGVGETSEERAVGYISANEPGKLITVFDWTFLWSVGVSWELF